MGAIEAIALTTAVLALAGTAWLPFRALRWVGGAWAAAALLVGLRPLLGIELACAVSVGLGVIAALRLPEALLRRIAFALPSLLLLAYVTAVLMYLAPGSPFANERAAPPEVEAALR